MSTVRARKAAFHGTLTVTSAPATALSSTVTGEALPRMPEASSPARAS